MTDQTPDLQITISYKNGQLEMQIPGGHPILVLGMLAAANAYAQQTLLKAAQTSPLLVGRYPPLGPVK